MGDPAHPKIAFLMPGVGVVRRGAEAFVIELAGALVRDHGFEVEILSRGPSPFPGPRVKALSRETSWVRRLYGLGMLSRKILGTLFLDPINLEWATASISAHSKLRDGGYDLAVIEGGIAGGWVGKRLRRKLGMPFVDVAHGNSVQWETAFARQDPDRVVVFTEAQAQVIRGAVPRARVEVIPHGIDLDLFHPGVSPQELELPRPVVLTAGSVDAQKRMHLAVEAVARTEGSLAVLGEGPAADALDRLAGERLGAGRYLRTSVPRDQMPAWYAAADVFTLPSETEAFGLVYLEALACGTPCVSPGDPVRREVLGDAALYTEPEDLASYARTLGEALERDWGDQPRRHAERFPFSRTAASYAGLFRRLLAPTS